MKKKLVLHICCAPDEAQVVKDLNGRYALHCFFCNPNIHPEAEYEKRRKEAERTAAHFSVPFTSDVYVPDSWRLAVQGFENTPEGGQRCALCFLLRLRRTARFCNDIGVDTFTTVMSISPYKRIGMLDEAGGIAANEYGITYAPFNFKKNDGYLKSIRLSRELGLYRQDYCGCELSRRECDARRNLHTRPAEKPDAQQRDRSDAL
jgi:predicted adenine nucleotide alpha hydrolase (AANH) superfamily ATPase